jgi:hypothetical protein
MKKLALMLSVALISLATTAQEELKNASDYDPMAGYGNRATGDVLLSWLAPAPIALCWGVGDDGHHLWITDPNGDWTKIYETTYSGVLTGNTITLDLGQSWIGDMASDGVYLYSCMVGGPNTIARIDLGTKTLAGTISGDWTYTSQRGLAYDAVRNEFYIGGWNSQKIWRVSSTGVTISTFTGIPNVSGLEWHPNGGPEGAGSLWVVENSVTDHVTEVDPHNGWAILQSFILPGSVQYSSAGAALHPSGALWLPNQSLNSVFLVDLGEPLHGDKVPLPNWALGIGILLILSFVVFRLRKG